MKKFNAMLLLDGYKLGHRVQYPKGTTKVYSTFTPRTSRIKGVDSAIMFGLQGFIKKWLVDYYNDNFFGEDIEVIVADYTRFIKAYLGGTDVDVSHIRALHKLGYLPIKIYALPEGSRVPVRVPMFTIESTHPEFFWITNYLETLISTELWYTITSANTSDMYRKIADEFAMKTVGGLDFVPFTCHDFSARGQSSLDSGTLSGMAHLLHFAGTDTVTSILALEQYYNADMTKELVGCSVNATEHAVMCAGQESSEYETYLRLITEVYPSGIVSIVSDTWDYWNVMTNTLPRLKEVIMGREGTVTIRPDCYDEKTMILTNYGWKYFKDVLETDLVAQINDLGEQEFVKPLKYVKQYYEGDMYRFKDNFGKMDLLVTPNHRMIFNSNGRELIQNADISKVGAWNKKIARTMPTKNKNIPLSDIDRLKIAFQADGSYTTDMRKIRFSFSKQRKFDRMTNILNNLGYEFITYNLKDGGSETQITCDISDFKKDFSWVDTSNMCSGWCKEFIEELSYWDSTRRSETRFKFDSTVKNVVDVVELISLSAGYGILISKYEDNRKENFSDVYTAHILKNNMCGGGSIKKEKIEGFKGNVYCVQVPSGRLLVKRNKCTAVCGNSGNPFKIVCGDEVSEIEHVKKGSIEVLWDLFGGTVNELGYKVLDSHISLIYGEAIQPSLMEKILTRLEEKGFASTNILFGVGSYGFLSAGIDGGVATRDSFGIAIKATYTVIDGEEIMIYKDPKTDDGTKKSLKGMVAVVKNIFGSMIAVDGMNEKQRDNTRGNMMHIVFEDGIVKNETTLAEIRARLR